MTAHKLFRITCDEPGCGQVLTAPNGQTVFTADEAFHGFAGGRAGWFAALTLPQFGLVVASDDRHWCPEHAAAARERAKQQAAHDEGGTTP